MIGAACDIAVLGDAEHGDACRRLAQQLSLPVVNSLESAGAFPFILIFAGDRLALQQTGAGAPGPVAVDFAEGAAAHRRNSGGGELIVKAVAGERQRRPTVFDATAGLGRDSFVLASRGYPVTLCERSAVIAALLEDGLRRAAVRQDAELDAILRRMTLHCGDAVAYLQQCDPQQRPDVVLIDPMFPASGKSALVKKEMRAFHQVVGPDCDSDSLLEAALAAARHRVVVKRPRKAEELAGKKPNFSISGKAIRFDIYTIKAFAKS